ncbi:hypothetical protein DFH06DRAFT_1149935 [Mycena polygramma]|nr:hypothetical protein DFH06DRAFT_1149935 [Mycena polygramma]
MRARPEQAAVLLEVKGQYASGGSTAEGYMLRDKERSEVAPYTIRVEEGGKRVEAEGIEIEWTTECILRERRRRPIERVTTKVQGDHWEKRKTAPQSRREKSRENGHHRSRDNPRESHKGSGQPSPPPSHDGQDSNGTLYAPICNADHPRTCFHPNLPLIFDGPLSLRISGLAVPFRQQERNTQQEDAPRSLRHWDYTRGASAQLSTKSAASASASGSRSSLSRSGVSSNSIGTPSTSAALPSLSGVSSCGRLFPPSLLFPLLATEQRGVLLTNCLAIRVRERGGGGLFLSPPQNYTTAFLACLGTCSPGTCLTASAGASGAPLGCPSDVPSAEAQVEQCCAAAATLAGAGVLAGALAVLYSASGWEWAQAIPGGAHGRTPAGVSLVSHRHHPALSARMSTYIPASPHHFDSIGTPLLLYLARIAVYLCLYCNLLDRNGLIDDWDRTERMH